MTAAVIFDPRHPADPAGLPDLDSREHIDAMVHGFYRRLLDDPQMAPLFLDVAKVDLNRHLPIICQYWHKMLLGDSSYQRHMMAKHRALDDQHPLTGELHERWLMHFMKNLEGRFVGPYTDKAKRIATRVIDNLHGQLSARRAGLKV